MRTTIVLITLALVPLAYHVNSTKLMGIQDSRAHTCTAMFATVLLVMALVGWLQVRRMGQARWLIWACIAAWLHAGFCLLQGWMVSTPDCFADGRPVRCGEPMTTPQIWLGCMGLWVIAGLSSLAVRGIAGPPVDRKRIEILAHEAVCPLLVDRKCACGSR